MIDIQKLDKYINKDKCNIYRVKSIDFSMKNVDSIANNRRTDVDTWEKVK